MALKIKDVNAQSVISLSANTSLLARPGHCKSYSYRDTCKSFSLTIEPARIGSWHHVMSH